MFEAPLPRSKHFLSDYINFLRTWAMDDSEDYPLSNSSGELEKLLLEDLARQARRAAGDGALLFPEDQCSALRELLGREGALQVTVRGVPPGLRAAKLLQVLDSDFSGRWVYVSDETLGEFPVAALKAACGHPDVRFLVVDVEKASAQNLIAAVAPVGNQLQVIVMTSGERVIALEGQSQSLDERWMLKNLTLDAQKKMLDAPIIFQGSTLLLRDIKSTWDTLEEGIDGKILSTIAKGDVPVIGEAPPAPENGNLYLPRTLEHSAQLDPSILSALDPQKDHLVLSGFSSKILEDKVATPGNTDVTQTSCTRWTVFPDQANSPSKKNNFFSDVCEKKKGLNVHWLECNGTGERLTVSWKRTAGSEAAVAPFVRLASGTCTRAPTCVHATEAACDAAAWKHQVGLLVGQPGIGKTQFLKRLAGEARVRAPGRWAVFVQALDHSNLLKKLPEPKGLRKEHLMELLVAAATRAKDNEASTSNEANAVRLCLGAALFRTGDIDVYVDGVDEVCPAFKDKLIRLLQLMLHTKVQRVWIASRPEVEIVLTERLGCQASSLCPFSKEEQKNYLCKHWSSTSPTCNGAPFKLECLAHELVEALHSAAGRGSERSLLDIPLHTQMAAEVYAERAEKAILTGSHRLPRSKNTLLDLYRDFVNKKRDLYKHRYGLDDAKLANVPFLNNFDAIHQKCAMFVLITNGGYENIDCGPFRKDFEGIKDELPTEKNGIVWLGEDGNPYFTHYTFVEYFASSWMLFHDGITSDKATIWSTLVCQKFGTGMRWILEHMLAEGHPLHEAALEGNEQALETALVTSDPNESDKFGRLALHLVASLGRADAVGALLAKGSDHGRRDSVLGWTALRYCTQTHQLEAAEQLLQAGADGADLCVDHIKNSAFIAAEKGFLQIMKTLLDSRNRNLLCEQKDGLSLLQISAIRRHYGIMEFLLESGADANKPVGDNTTQLMLAVQERDVPSVRILLEHKANACAVDSDGWTPVHYAAHTYDEDDYDDDGDVIKIMELLLEKGASVDTRLWQKMTLLMLAAEKGNVSFVRLLLQHGANVHAVDSDGRTPIFYAAKNWTGGDDDVEIMKLLLEKGVDVDTRLDQGRTLLMLAVGNSNVSFVSLLLQHGANVHAVDTDGRTPIYYATNKWNGDVDVETVKLLLDKGANVETRIERDMTLLLHAAQRRNVSFVRLLLQHGANVHAVDREGKTPVYYAANKWNDKVDDVEIMKLLLENGSNVDTRIGDKMTLLMLAVERRNVSFVRLLLQHGANVHAVDRKGRTPIYYSANKWNSDIDVEIIKLLLDKGANVDTRLKEEMTLLMLATERRSVSLMQILLEFGANVDAIDSNGYTPIHYAVNKGNGEVHNVSVLGVLLERHPNMEARDRRGRTPLMFAAEQRNVSLVRLLLEHGADGDAIDNNGWTYIHYAANKWDGENDYDDIMKILLEGHPNVDVRDKKGRTLLMLAVQKNNVSFVRLLLAHGADVNAVDSDSLTPVYYAANNREFNDDIMRVLFEKRPNVEAQDKEGRTLLMLAAQKNNTLFVQLLLAHGADVNAIDNECLTPVHYAARNGNHNNVEIMRVILETHPNVDVRDKLGRTPLMFAVKNRNESLVRLLLDCEANVHDVDSNGCTPIDYAAQNCKDAIGIIKHLLVKGANVDARDKKGRTLLMLAVQKRNVPFVRLLLDYGANVHALDSDCFTPVHYAASKWDSEDNNDVEIINVLFERRPNVDTPDKHGRTLLMLTIQTGNVSFVRLLLDYGANVHAVDSDGLTAVHYAANEWIRMHYNVEIMKVLLERDPNVEARDKQGRTLLMLAVQMRNVSFVRLLLDYGANVHAVDRDCLTPIHYAVREWKGRDDDFEIIKVLLERHPNVEARDKQERTLLMLAAQENNVSFVRLLLAHGADVNSVDMDCLTPVHYAVNKWNGKDDDFEIMRVLLDEHQNVDARDKRGRTPLMYAAEKRNASFVRFLLEHGADGDTNDNNGWTPLLYTVNKWHGEDDIIETIEVLLERYPNVDARDKLGRTMLMFAAEEKNVSFVRLLLDHGANVCASDGDLWTPVHYACNKGNGEVHNVEILSFLLERQPNVNARDKQGRTPLMFAVKRKNKSFVRLLLDYEANVHEVDSKGCSPIDYAARNCSDHHDNVEIIKHLLEKGAHVEARDNQGRTLLMFAAEKRNESFVRLLLAHGADVRAVDSNDWTSIHYASQKCNWYYDDPIMKLLLERTDVDVRDKQGRTLLMLEAYKKNVSFVRLLIAHGADVDAVDGNGRTPLHYAAKIWNADDVEVMKLLLERTNVDVRDTEGKTLLMLAILERNVTLVRLLLDYGANVRVVDRYGFTPMYYAARICIGNTDNEIMKLLLEKRANVDGRTNREERR